MTKTSGSFQNDSNGLTRLETAVLVRVARTPLVLPTERVRGPRTVAKRRKGGRGVSGAAASTDTATRSTSVPTRRVEDGRFLL